MRRASTHKKQQPPDLLFDENKKRKKKSVAPIDPQPSPKNDTPTPTKRVVSWGTSPRPLPDPVTDDDDARRSPSPPPANSPQPQQPAAENVEMNLAEGLPADTEQPKSSAWSNIFAGKKTNKERLTSYRAQRKAKVTAKQKRWPGKEKLNATESIHRRFSTVRYFFEDKIKKKKK